MTKEQETYIKQQQNIIQDKNNENELRRYEALLWGAELDIEVSEPLKRACETRREELARPLPMAVNGDIDDIN